MKKLTLMAAAMAFAAGAAQAQDVVRMGSEGAYPPYNFINEQNELDGFERELGDLMCEMAGLTCEWVLNDWDTIIPNLVAGNFDTIMAGMSITEARSKVISFTQNYLPPDPSAFVALAGADESVKTGVVATQSNTVQSGFIADSDADLIEFATPDETIAAVRAGEADAVLADKAFLAPFVEASGGQLVFVGEDVYLGDGVGMGLRQSDVELREAFNAAITELKEDGRLNEMIVRWFGEDFPTFE